MQQPVKRIRDLEITLPVAVGTAAFWLGKKADEYQSHRWTVYLRAVNNEDLGDIIQRVVFQLHPSFQNPMRELDAPPFELTEVGWGEFEIQISVHFHSDAAEKPVDLFHHLKLYPDEEAAAAGTAQSTKKPVVVESYEEIVFAEPNEPFLHRIRGSPAVKLTGTPAALAALEAAPPLSPISGGKSYMGEQRQGDTKEHPFVQWFVKHSEEVELSKLSAARQKVAVQMAKLQKDYDTLDAEVQRIRGGQPAPVS
eukprot:SM000084S23168  [mRNA]  locus=s84:568591:570281:- [translate_table: standard]